MAYWIRNRWLVALAVGLLGGLFLSGFWPHTPLHAVSTDRVDTFAMATGPVDADTEAVYFLDFLTGDLRAAAINPRMGKFNAFFQVNVLQAMGIDVSKNPKFLMITGVSALRRGAGPQWGSSAVYVAETTTGVVAAFATPWPREMANAVKTIQAPMRMLDMAKFRTAAVRTE